MSHEITRTNTGTYEFAFSGSRSAIWHGLGQELSEDSPIDVWKVEAGMDWLALSRPEGELLRPPAPGALTVRTLRKDGMDLAV